MAHQAKVFANVFTRKRGATSGTIDFSIEFVLLTGDVRSGKVNLIVSDLRSEDRITSDLKDGLVAHLNSLYSPETFQDKDIVGLSV